MKLVLAIVSNDDAPIVISELMRASFSATRLASSGGFLHVGNTTLMIGVQEERLPLLMELIGKYCKKRKQIAPPVPAHYGEGSVGSIPVEVTLGGATVFVLDVEDFERL